MILGKTSGGRHTKGSQVISFASFGRHVGSAIAGVIAAIGKLLGLSRSNPQVSGSISHAQVVSADIGSVSPSGATMDASTISGRAVAYSDVSGSKE